jgi:hypothetical protein
MRAVEQAKNDLREQRELDALAKARATVEWTDFDGDEEAEAVAEIVASTADEDGDLTPATIDAVAQATGRATQDVAVHSPQGSRTPARSTPGCAARA